jgi:hypothetical protein
MGLLLSFSLLQNSYKRPNSNVQLFIRDCNTYRKFASAHNETKIISYQYMSFGKEKKKDPKSGHFFVCFSCSGSPSEYNGEVCCPTTLYELRMAYFLSLLLAEPYEALAKYGARGGT